VAAGTPGVFALTIEILAGKSLTERRPTFKKAFRLKGIMEPVAPHFCKCFVMFGGAPFAAWSFQMKPAIDRPIEIAH
jgi:hypothetical protein